MQALGVLQGQQCRLWWWLHCGPLAHSQVHGLGLRAWCVWLEGRAARLFIPPLVASLMNPEAGVPGHLCKRMTPRGLAALC